LVLRFLRLETIAVVARGIDRRFGRCHPEEFAASGELLRAMAVAEEAEVPDAVEPVRQHMDQEATDEFVRRERHRLLAIVVLVILPAEADLAVIHRHKAVDGDGDAMRIAADVSDGQMSGLHKASILMLTLGEEQAGKLLATMHEDEVRSISATMAGVPHVRRGQGRENIASSDPQQRRRKVDSPVQPKGGDPRLP
jgi:hypothetical protein